MAQITVNKVDRALHSAFVAFPAELAEYTVEYALIKTRRPWDLKRVQAWLIGYGVESNIINHRLKVKFNQ